MRKQFLAAVRTALTAIFFIGGTSPGYAQSLSTLYTFGNGNDGDIPQAGVVQDSKGNLYGTTQEGGLYQNGTVFEITAAGVEKVLYNFTGGTDGAAPLGGVVRDTKGRLYGTTYAGGQFGAGTVYKLLPNGTLKVLYAFTGNADGSNPFAGVTLGTSGILYGTTLLGGASGNGTVYEVSPAGKEKVLHSFTGADGSLPYAGVSLDAKGNLYGATAAGTIFEITAFGSFKVLFTFDGADGEVPYGTPIADSQGNVYGTTSQGGKTGNGTVFEITAAGKLKTLHSFGNPPDGAESFAGLVMNSKATLFGTTYQGGDFNLGTIFQVTLAGQERVLYSFMNQGDGYSPFAGLFLNSKGILYGTTNGGPGTVFQFVP